MSNVLSAKQSQQLEAVVAKRGTGILDRQEILGLSNELFGKPNSLAWIAQKAEKPSWGKYDITNLVFASNQPDVSNQVSYANSNVILEARKKAPVVVAEGMPIVDSDSSYLPVVDKNYVPHANMKLLEPIISSGLFYPVFITGLSGNGKTTMVQQVCAKLNRELFRANITVETDEDDLLGGFRLVNGDTVWQDGVVVEAMRRGAVLLLDEVDLASNKIMCLQSALEGKAIYLKKINQVVEPAKGFTVVATANTKGKGDNTGAFIGTNVLNEAFLDRFPITIYQDYPTRLQEVKILDMIRASIGATGDEDFSGKLVTWAANIRKAYEEEAVTEIITTRRLINIVQAQHIFKDRQKSIELCIERFDEETKKAFLDFYKALDGGDEQTATTQAGAEQISKEDVLAW